MLLPSGSECAAFEERRPMQEERKLEFERQVERILRMGSGDRRQVIVRIASPSDDKEALINIASDAIRQRNMALSARECLPPAVNRQMRPMGRQSPSQRQTIYDEEKSFTGKVDKSTVKSIPKSELKARGESFLGDLLQTDFVQKTLHDEKKKSRRRVAQTQSPGFWTSKSMLLEVSKQDLEILPNTMTEIRDIYPNRLLRAPQLVEARALPDAVLEKKASSWGVDKIGALAAWGAYESRGQGVKVGILDTGIDANHPDIKGKVVAFAEFDAEGKQVRNAKPHDSDQHGTHCAGSIVGGYASGQWIGVAPEARLAVALVLNGAIGGTDAQVLAGIDWLVEQNVDVISMSLGGLTLDTEMPNTYTEALLTCLRLGIPVVTAIGNEGSQTTGSPGNDLFAFAVGATDYLDRAAGFSGGRTHVIRQSSFIPPESLPLPYSKPDVSAPGVAITSSIPKNNWAAFNGTSMATPHVAGALALILSATDIRQQVPASERAFVLQDLLTGSAEELGESGQNHRFGFGRIDVLRAIGFAIERGYGTSLGPKPPTKAATKAARKRSSKKRAGRKRSKRVRSKKRG
jgi:subtilase family protein